MPDPISALLTVEQFWQYPGCAHYSREEAEEILHMLTQYAEIVYAVHSQATGQQSVDIEMP